MFSRTCVRMCAKKMSQMTTVDIVGSDTLAGKRMSAGSVLGMMDLAAARTVITHCEDYLEKNNGTVVTVAVDGCDFSSPIRNGDMLKMESCPVLVGNSSVTVNLECSRRELRTRRWELTQKASFIMVVVDKDTLRPLSGIPQVEYDTSEKISQKEAVLSRRAVVKEWERLNVELEQKPVSELMKMAAPDGEIEKDPGIPRIAMHDTRIELRRMFLPRSLNMNNTVFGGDVLEWMETGASHCAMNFVGHRDVHTIAMNRVVFKHPIFTHDSVQMTCDVVYVSTYTIHIEVKVIIDRPGLATPITSHVGHFVCMQHNPDTGTKQLVMTGLNFPNNDADLRRHVAAKLRYDFWKLHYRTKLVANQNSGI
eukprot:TRINITY_DN15111_c0_g1_i1.p1 TRINITY_DN15111_c0_g1~~TRINITY_DN15111_c0_g1_i1.p1  ORF type:complete len:366 (+),score=57.69 TRINITY_DN15111_c0_g1_i1:199-1296(+)